MSGDVFAALCLVNTEPSLNVLHREKDHLCISRQLYRLLHQRRKEETITLWFQRQFNFISLLVIDKGFILRLPQMESPLLFYFLPTRSVNRTGFEYFLQLFNAWQLG